MRLSIIIISFGIFLSAAAPAFATPLLERQFESLIVDNGLERGMQSACVEDSSGESLSYNTDMRVIPASVSKVYVFDFALSKLPIDFRYTTTFYLQDKTLYINGSGDPYFTIEHLRSVIQKIYTEKKVRIETFVFSPNFYFNWNTGVQPVQQSLFASLKAESKSLPIANKIRVTVGTNPYIGTGSIYQFQSAPLSALLKQTNNYSTNAAADALFIQLGGSNAFAAYMSDTYGVGSDVVSFGRGSGLDSNFTTCSLTIRVLKHLDKTLRKNGFALTDIMSLPNIDPGVLSKRIIDIHDAESIVAKSGFINRHHTLAGAINTDEGKVYFAIFTYFNDDKKSIATKAMIDIFLERIVDQYRFGLKSFEYSPNLAIFKDTKFSKVVR